MDQSQISEKHKSAIISACIAMRKYLDDLRRLMIDGECPESTGFNGRPMPLSDPEAAQLEREIEGIEGIIGKIEEAVGKDMLKEAQDPLLTRMWASVILGRIEGILKAMEPDSLERARGAMPQSLRNLLMDEVSTLERKVRALRDRYTTAK